MFWFRDQTVEIEVGNFHRQRPSFTSTSAAVFVPVNTKQAIASKAFGGEQISLRAYLEDRFSLQQRDYLSMTQRDPTEQ